METIAGQNIYACEVDRYIDYRKDLVASLLRLYCLCRPPPVIENLRATSYVHTTYIDYTGHILHDFLLDVRRGWHV